MNTKKSTHHTTHQIYRTFSAGFILILMIAGFLTVTANTANAATYYLDAGVTTSRDGKSWATAFKTIADAQTALNALPNKGSGNTVEVNTGNYGSYIETDKSRTDWLTYKAAVGKTPVLEKISIQNSTKQNTYLKFDGFKVQAPVPDPMPVDDGNNWKSGNMMLRLSNANYVNVSNCNFVGYNKYLTTGQDVRNCDYFTYHHNRQQKTRNGILVKDSISPTITNNYISEMADGSGISIYTGCPNATVSYNHVFGMYTHKDDPYFPHDLVGDAAGRYHPGSLMSIRSSPITISNNIIHDGGSQLLMFYDDSGPYSDVLMENNLLYDGGFDDGVSPSYFTGRVAFYKLAPSLTHPIVIRNNTFVGRVENSSVSLGSLPSRYYGNTVYSYNNYTTPYDGAGLTVVNNILVGSWSSTGNGLPHPSKYPNMTEGYNIAWYRTPNVGGSYLNNTIAFWYNGAYHGYPCYFEDLGGSTPDTNEYDYSRDGVTQFFVAGGMHFGPAGNYADRISDRAGLLDFRLAVGSPAIGSGYHLNQPSDSLGTTEPNGFIKDDGPARDASHHSIGCYEYGPTDLSFPPIGNKEVNEGSPIIFTVDVNDPNMKTFIEEHNLPSEPNFINNIFSWTPTYNDAGSYEATFVAQNDQFEDFETISINVNNVNRSPLLAAIGDKSVNENSLLNFPVSATDPDGNSITYSAENLPNGAAFANQTFNWTPDYSQSGTYQVKFTASDGQAQDFQTVNLTVNNVNRPPAFTAIGDKSVNENSLLNFLVSATDPDGDSITYSAEGLPSGAAFANQTFNWTPDYSQSGTYQVKFTASDGQTQDSQTINLTVNNVNREPVLAAIGNKSVNENSLLNFLISATDPDGDSITYSAENLPRGAAFAGQTFNWTPDYNQSGTYQVKFTASDGQAQSSQTINLTVNDVVASLLNENFDNGTFTGWSIIDEGTKSAPSSWSAVSGAMVQTSNIYTLSFPSQPGTYALYKAGTTWTNYRVSLTMKSADSESLGVMFRYKDKNNYYRFAWDKNRKQRQLVKKYNGNFTVLATNSGVPYTIGRDYKLNIIAKGTSLQVFIDNVLVLQTTDNSISLGSIALYSWANSGSYFDNIVVEKL